MESNSTSPNKLHVDLSGGGGGEMPSMGGRGRGGRSRNGGRGGVGMRYAPPPPQGVAMGGPPPSMAGVPPVAMQQQMMMVPSPYYQDDEEYPRVSRGGGRGGRGGRGSNNVTLAGDQSNNRSRRGTAKGRRTRVPQSTPLSAGGLNVNAAAWSPGQGFQASAAAAPPQQQQQPPTRPPVPRYAAPAYGYAPAPDMYFPTTYQPSSYDQQQFPLQPMPTAYPPVNPPLPPGPPPPPKDDPPDHSNNNVNDTNKGGEGVAPPAAAEQQDVPAPTVVEEAAQQPRAAAAVVVGEATPAVEEEKLAPPAVEKPPAPAASTAAIVSPPATTDATPKTAADQESPAAVEEAPEAAEISSAPVAAAAAEDPSEENAGSEEAKRPLAEPNEKPTVRPAKKSLKKRAAGYENRSSGDVLDAFTPPEEPTPAAVSAVEEQAQAPGVAEDDQKEPEVADNWEDVSASPKPTASEAEPSTEESAPEEEKRTGRRVYSKNDLLDLRAMTQDAPMPASLPSFYVEKPKDDGSRGRRLGPGGNALRPSANAGKGGDLDDARRAAPNNSQGHSYRRQGADAGTWTRGARPRGNNEADALPNEPLKKSAHRWDPAKAKANADATERAVANAMSILNKMAPENFEKLFAQMAAIEMLSLQMLERVIKVVFEKAIDEPHFAVVYSEFCKRMTTEQANKVWPFVRVVRDDVEKRWSWIVDLQVDSSKLLPIDGDLDAASALLKRVVDLDDQLLAASGAPPTSEEGEDGKKTAAEGGGDDRGLAARIAREKRRLAASGDDDTAHLGDVLPESHGVGQLKLVAADCVVREDRALVCFAAPQQRPGVLFAVLVEASALLSTSSGLCKFGGSGFETRREAQAGAIKKSSFKRLLLNQCEEGFKNVAGASAGETALAEMATAAMQKQEEATNRARQDAIDKGLPPPIPPDVLTHEEWVVKLKRRMLGIVRFIGELFKQELLKERIMHECISLLIGKNLEDLTTVPDNESIEASAKLFLTIGKRLESTKSSKETLNRYFAYFKKLSTDKRLAARTRFLLQDLADTRQNGWKERRAKDTPYKLAGSQQQQQQQQQQQARPNYQAAERDALRQQRARESQDVRQRMQQQNKPAATPKILARGSHTSESSTPASKRAPQQQQQQQPPPQQQKQPTPAAAATPPPAAAKDWSDERIDNRVRSTLDEHASIGDEKEFFDSFDEMPARGATRLATMAVEKYVIEGKSGQRDAVYGSLAILIKSGRLRHEHLTAALEPSLRDLYDTAVDVPKVYDWVADLVAMCLLLGALNPSWLSEHKGRRVLGELDPSDEFMYDDMVEARKRFFKSLLDALPRQAGKYYEEDAGDAKKKGNDPATLANVFRPLSS